MPLVNEIVVPAGLKDAFNSLPPEMDASVQAVVDKVNDPEAPKLIEAIYKIPAPAAPRDDIFSVFLTGVEGSFRGPGIFARLRSMQPGEQIRIRRADASLAVFAVTQVVEYAKREFPTEIVYRGNGDASLRLITCGGEFDRRSKSYLRNVVVFAAPV